MILLEYCFSGFETEQLWVMLVFFIFFMVYSEGVLTPFSLFPPLLSADVCVCDNWVGNVGLLL